MDGKSSSGPTDLTLVGALVRRRQLFAAVLALAYLVSLIAPAARDTQTPTSVYPGYLVLIIGVLGAFEGQFAWWANLPFAGSIVVLLTGTRVPRWLALMTLAIAADSLFWRNVYGDDGEHPITTGWGMWLWLACMVVLAAFSLVDRKPRLKSDATPANPA